MHEQGFINFIVRKECLIVIAQDFLAHRGRMSSERYCHTPGVVVVDNFRLKFLFINLSQVKVSVY